MTENAKNKKVEKVRKGLIKTLVNFRPNKLTAEKKINLLPLLGMIIGFLFAVMYLIYFWDELSDIIFLSRFWYRFAALPAVIGFPITSALIGIIVGKLVEIVINKLGR